MRKLYIIKKYIYAESIKEALVLEKKTNPDDIWIDDDWRKNMMEKEKPIGFNKK